MRRVFFYIVSVCAMVFGLHAESLLKTFTITVNTPQEMFIKDPVTNENQAFWVVTYQLENSTGEDRELALKVFIESDVKRLDQELKRTSCLIHSQLQRIVQEKNKRHYLNYIEMSEHPFRRGEVRDGVFIFKRPARRADQLTLYIDGLSGVEVKEESSDHLKKVRSDFIHIVRPEKIYYDEREEERYRPYTQEDILKADGTTFQERLVYRQRFVRQGDEFHVHEDDIKSLKNELDRWVLVLKPVEN